MLLRHLTSSILTRINVDDVELKNARVMLTYLTKNTISEALDLLGIEASRGNVISVSSILIYDHITWLKKKRMFHVKHFSFFSYISRNHF